MTHPKPDRSNYKPNRSKTPDNDAVDIGWNEGFLSDGRPYRVECWAHDGVTSLTFFISTAGLEQYNNVQFVELLDRESLVQWHPGVRRSAYAMPFTDASGNSLWSVNLVVGDDNDTLVADSVSIRAYA
jgi:hypothetical protein